MSTTPTPKTEPRPGPLLRRVSIRNYKSIGACDLQLEPLTLLVGGNGAGKSNFLDALRFVAEGLQTSLDHAVKSRGGIEGVRRRSTGHPRNFAITLHLDPSLEQDVRYHFEIKASPQGGFVVKREELTVRHPTRNETIARFVHDEGHVTLDGTDNPPPASPDRLYLVTVAGLPAFRPTFDALTSMGFYNLNPEAMKEMQSPDAGELLRRDGSNVASVVGRLQAERPMTLERIRSYLETIVPGITDVDRVQLGPRETLEFKQRIAGSKHPWRFYAASMSDGTLRAFGMLVAVGQLVGHTRTVRLVGIEEPETALHPAAAGALMDAVREATDHTQVVVTTHSPELLDHANPATETLLFVQSTDGDTQITSFDEASLQAIQGHLYSPGDLLRMDQIGVNQADLRRQLELFAESGTDT